MVNAGNIVLRITLDLAQFNNALREIDTGVVKLKGSVDKVTPSMDKMGESTVTNAVRFQTMTQGAINLTTAFTQTYTSISNLQRAKTSLQAAAVGVERAIDLQRRKQFQLNEEQKKAVPNMQKIQLLTNELATAHDDLAVKQQRVKDQADAVNDTYILFALNIANVGFSAVQTGLSMAKMASGIKLATVASTAFNIATSKWTLIALAAIAAWEGVAAVVGLFNKEAGKNISIMHNVIKMMDEFGSATDINLDNYDSKIKNITSSTSDFKSSWSDMTNTVDSNTTKQIQIMAFWQREMKKSINNVSGAIKDMPGGFGLGTGGSQRNFQTAQQGNNTKIPITAGHAILGMRANSVIWNDLNQKLISLVRNLFPDIPEANAEQMLTRNVTGQIKANLSKSNLSDIELRQIYSEIKDIPFSKIDPAIKYKLFSKEFPSYFDFAGTITHHQNNPLAITNSAFAERYGGFQGFETPSELSFNNKRNDLLRRIETLQVMISFSVPDSENNVRMRNKLEDLQGELDVLDSDVPLGKQSLYVHPGLTQGTSFNKIKAQMFKASSPQVSASRERHRKAINKIISNSSFLYSGDIVSRFKSVSGGTQLSESIGRRVFYSGIGGKAIAQGVLDGIFFGHGTAGSGSGPTNNPFFRELEKAQLESMGMSTLGGRTGTTPEQIYEEITGFKTTREGAINRLNAIRANNNRSQLLSMGAVSSISNILPPALKHLRFSAKAIQQGFVSVSGSIGGSYRFTNRNNLALQQRAIQLNFQDENLNRLRSGGILRDGFQIDEQDAVIGGFKSLSLQQANNRTVFANDTRVAEGILKSLGAFAPNSGSAAAINGQSARNIAQANAISGLLASTGFSLSAAPDLLYRNPRSNRMGSYMNYQASMANMARENEVRYNAWLHGNQVIYNKAVQVDLLQGGFGLSGYTGFGGSLESLQLEVARQDSLIKLIGLNRTEAFQIIDTEGRGRTEIDDRVRFSQRLASISTGSSII